MKRDRIVLLVLLLVFTAVMAGCANAGGQQAASETPSKADASGEDTQIEGTSPSDVSEDSAVIVTNGGSKIRLSSLEYYVESEDAPVVYYLSDITPEAMVEIYHALEWTPTGKAAVKLLPGSRRPPTISARN